MNMVMVRDRARPEQLFYDELNNFYSKQVGYSKGRFGDIKKKVSSIVGNATPFLLEQDVVQDLHDLSDSGFVDPFNAGHLPFPTIFFEFRRPLEIQLGGSGKNLKAILYGPMQDIDIGTYVVPSEPILSEGSFSANFFFTDHLRNLPTGGYPFPAYRSVTFNPKNLDDAILMSSGDAVYSINDDTQVFQVPAIMSNPIGDYDLPTLKKEYQRLARFCVNVVEFINAHNVVAREAKRGEVKRRKKSKKSRDKPERVLKPYYWAEIRIPPSMEGRQVASHINEDTDRPFERLPVKAHFQTYHTKQGRRRIWVSVYYRGPDGAPIVKPRMRVRKNGAVMDHVKRRCRD